MVKFIMLVAIGTAGWLIYKLYYQKLLQQGRPGMIKLALIVLGLIFMALAVTGRAHFIFALIGAAMTQVFRLLPLLVRYAPFLSQMLKQGKVFTPNSGQTSKVRTSTLVMTLDHDSGHIDGEIIAGDFEGRSLADLSDAELQQLYHYCERVDTEALRLLQAYIARSRSGGQWQQDKTGSNSNGDTASISSAEPGVAESFEILGLEADASHDDVVAAHRRLMSRMHPDKGGSNYLAARINAAKKVLLRHISGTQE